MTTHLNGTDHECRAQSALTLFNRFRIDVIATWPEGEGKQAAMAAAKAALQGGLAFERVASAGRRLGALRGQRLRDEPAIYGATH